MTASSSESVKRLSDRAERAFRFSSVSDAINNRRAIVGPRRLDVLTAEAEAARNLLQQGLQPTIGQLASLEQAIRVQRPALTCVHGDLTPLPLEGNWLAVEWTQFQPALQKIQRSVARLERIDDPEPGLGSGRTVLGTGFLVAPDLLVTAAHVVDELSFLSGQLERGQAVADFHGYLGTKGSKIIDVTEVVGLNHEADLALLRLAKEPSSGKPRSNLRAEPLPIEPASPAAEKSICVVGYPLDDHRNPAPLVSVLFGRRFGIKRAAIGEILEAASDVFYHDCTTLAGNSGSPVIDISSKRVCGVHTSGRLMLRNQATGGRALQRFLDPYLKQRFPIHILDRSMRTRSTPVAKHDDNFESYYKELNSLDTDLRDEMDAALEELATDESAGKRSLGFQRETIVLTKGRPVLDIKEGEAVVDIQEIESKIWTKRLKKAMPLLSPGIAAVGRIELANHPRGVDWLGTGWVIHEDIIVTNRHVAEIFGKSNGQGFFFRPGFEPGPMEASIDFLEEFGSRGSHAFSLFKIVHIEHDNGPDVAFLRIEPVTGQSIPDPVPLSDLAAKKGDHVALIGYPAKDRFFPDQDLMRRIFNDRYDKKRLSPGLITGLRSDRVFHDCSSLGGASGGATLSLDTGKAVALHFAGTLFTKNHAVPIKTVRQRLAQVLGGNIGTTPVMPSTSGGEIAEPQSKPVHSSNGKVIEATIPIKVRVEIGDVMDSDAQFDRPNGGSPIASARPLVDAGDGDLIATEEARPEDYIGRSGYVLDFLGSQAEVPLPELTDNIDDILTFDFEGETQQVLNYQHFSVLMSRSRRGCRYSACNIDGRQLKRPSRRGWRLDPRIPESAQIRYECYGNPPKFSRGHMTRRLDPAWGSTADAKLGNTDSMHVTNAVPQIQPFNGGIWLDLEDYALENADRDDMRISVFTGPFFADDDQERFGVKIPLRFWKVIAFIHDETSELTATGYTMSQESFIGEDEFIFGQHENTQVTVRSIEVAAGLSFGNLASLDPIRDQPESARRPLSGPNQIQWA